MIRVMMLPQAAEAILDQADYYRDESGETLARRWHLSVDRTIRALAMLPGQGAPCRFASPVLADVLRFPIDSFSRHLLFYRLSARQDLLTIIHVIHGAREIEAILTEGTR